MTEALVSIPSASALCVVGLESAGKERERESEMTVCQRRRKGALHCTVGGLDVEVEVLKLITNSLLATINQMFQLN